MATSRATASDGYGGARHQYLDEIRFVPVPDANTRVEAAVSGQYDYVDSIPVRSFDKLKASSAPQPSSLKPFGYPVFVFNTAAGRRQECRRFARQSARRSAWRTCWPRPSAARISTRSTATSIPVQFVWNTDAGVEGNYNVADPEGAAAAAKTAGYNGEPIRILTSRQYEFHYKMAQVAAEYLKLAGFAVDLQVVDWATLTQRRTDPKLWDIYITHSPFLPEPALIGSLSPSSPGWWDTPARKTVVDAFTSEVDPRSASSCGPTSRRRSMTRCPFMKIGDFNAVSAKSTKLDGVDPAPGRISGTLRSEVAARSTGTGLDAGIRP